MDICPIISRMHTYKKIDENITKEEFDSSSRSPFVSRFGYPNINVGVLAPPGVVDATDYDAPKDWAKNNYQIPKILELRSAMVNSRFPALVKGGVTRELEKTQNITLGKAPVALDVKLKRRPNLNITIKPEVAPMGPQADLDRMEIIDNPKVPKAVDKAVSDDELKAVTAIDEMSHKGIDENYLRRLLSVGLLGVKKDRKLVPTRWAITATDDTIGKLQRKKIRDYKHADYQAFLGGYLGNFYLIMLIPSIFRYELFEMFAVEGIEPKFTTDWEDHKGRKNYAKTTAGGYYATRLGISEKMISLKRQGAALAIRFITDEYTIGLGVWVVREATRKSLLSKPIHFASLELMIQYAKMIAKRKYGVPIEHILKASKLLEEVKNQKTLGDY